jgi:ABC-type Fe3+/spermidine/putrescine transport system ATPase subunit
VIEADVSLRLGDFELETRLEAGEEILSLFGPSGAGKSTLLRVLAGLADPDSGHVRIDGEVAHGDGPTQPPEDRPIGLVLQGPSLFPHLNVEGNIRFAGDGPHSDRRLARLLRVTRLEGLESRYPTELSGGQQQRVALARALMRRPRVLLLDEPFSSLDSNMRERLQRDVRDIQATFGLCVIYVTHELRDACAMGDRMAVIGDGRIEQTDEPLEVIRHPATYDVARFVGMRNLFEGEVVAVDEGLASVRVGGVRLHAAVNPRVAASSEVYLGVRTEDFRVYRSPDEGQEPAANAITVTIWNRVLRGATFTLTGEANGADGRMHVEIELAVRTYETLDLAAQKEVTVTVPAKAVHLIPRATDNPAGEPTRAVTTASPRSS